ncbi:MAG: 2-oxoglutarate dehydrogenase complex dihydrolipoyllysine-residue succinyltransferase [Planctomycetota bacterium]|jgi:2-oxoglutarate dehydrogenase E2 component (dihydrolipoamide succinyltransferase)
MKQEIQVPSVGESITTGIIVSWIKVNGDQVREGDMLFELETEKAVLEIPSTGDGILEILVEAGTEVKIGQTVAMLSPSGVLAPESSEPGAVEAIGSTASVLSPAVRRIITENNLDPEKIRGTGKGGRITKEDALDAAQKKIEPAGPTEEVIETESAPPLQVQSVAPADEGVEGVRHTKRVPMSGIRKRIAKRLVQAKQNAAYLTTFNEIDMQKVIDIRTHYKEQFQKEHGIKIGFMSFFVKACCQSLKEFPAVNSQIDGDDIIYKYFYDIGVAISIEQGLMVPIIRDADKRHFADIEAAIASLVQRARDKKLMPDELAGGTFTITNGGVFGSLLSTPIPAYPQTAILGMHAIKKRPIVVDDQIVIHPMMYVALTYDHRVIDGREAVSFLARVKEFIEQPDMLLLEM